MKSKKKKKNYCRFVCLFVQQPLIFTSARVTTKPNSLEHQKLKLRIYKLCVSVKSLNNNKIKKNSKIVVTISTKQTRENKTL